MFKEQAVVTSVEESTNRSTEGSSQSADNTGICFNGKIFCNYFLSHSYLRTKALVSKCSDFSERDIAFFWIFVIERNKYANVLFAR